MWWYVSQEKSRRNKQEPSSKTKYHRFTTPKKFPKKKFEKYSIDMVK